MTIGTLSGFYGGRLDNVLMRCLDVIFAFPAILLALAIVATLGPSISNAMLAITVVGIPSFARLIRASVLSLKEQVFVEAARALGAGSGRIVLRHILPNSVSTVVVYGTLEVGKTVVFAARAVVPGAWRPAADARSGARCWRTVGRCSRWRHTSRRCRGC